jgi:hypothetical protein
MPTVGARTPDDNPLRRWVYVAEGPRKVQLPWRAEEATWALALRAAFALGGLPIDSSGRIVGGWRAVGPSPAGATVEPGAWELVFVPQEERMLEIRVVSEPSEPTGSPEVPIRLRTPVALVVPTGWVVAGLVRWLGLPPVDWAVWTDGPVDDEQLLCDAIGTATTLELRRR